MLPSGFRPMRREDVHRQVAKLHREGIDRGFLATLGEEFLTQMYAAIDAGPDSVLIVESTSGSVTGFVSGAGRMGPIYRRMLRRPLALALALLPAVVNPTRLRRIIEILRYGRADALPPGVPDPELLSIVVAASSRGQGVADRLYGRLVEHFRLRGESGFRIVVGSSLAPAHSFYRRMGAQPIGEIEVHRGERSVVYVHRLDTSEREVSDVLPR